jgi:hypothetical protein
VFYVLFRLPLVHGSYHGFVIYMCIEKERDKEDRERERE